MRETSALWQDAIFVDGEFRQRGIADAYTRELAARAERITVGNTVTEDVGLGPMINEKQLDRAGSCWTRRSPRGPRSWRVAPPTGRFSARPWSRT